MFGDHSSQPNVEGAQPEDRLRLHGFPGRQL